MLQQEFLKAEKLAKENDTSGLNAMRASYDKKVARTALLGLVSLLLLFFGEWTAGKFAPGMLASSELFRSAMLFLPAVCIFLYFFLSKRFTDGRQLVDLALELKKRESLATAKKEG